MRVVSVTVSLALLVSCGQSAPSQAPSVSREESAKMEAYGYADDAPADGAPAAPPASVAVIRGGDVKEKSLLLGMLSTRGESGAGAAADLWADEEEESDKSEGKDAGGGAAVRQWFPESFLWRPMVETGPGGEATLDVRVPDTLTTWRVLALGQTRGGQQAGAAFTFDSTLPLYVDPVVPGWLYAGDRLDLPVQVVNTTKDPVATSLEVTAWGAISGGGLSKVSLASHGSDVARVPLVVSGAGEAKVKAVLGGADAAERTIPVTPAGRPVEGRRGGTLAGPRAFELTGPAGADPLTQELAVVVFPGPLAVLQAEVARSGDGALPWTAAYGFALSTHLSTLAARTGVEVDGKAVRRQQMLAWQRVVRHARSPDGGTASDLLAGVRGVQGHELAVDLEARLARQVEADQRADGTWARQSRASLQQVLVQTAWAGRLLPADRDGARLRASGAIERHQREITDPYTAAVVLASGLAPDHLAERLRALVEEGATQADDGTRSVTVPEGVVNAWGRAPSKAEMLAWTALALDDGPLRGDAVSELMSGYDAAWGFGAGPADVVALEAVVAALPGITQPVDVVLALDGVEVSRAKLDPSQPMAPVVLSGQPGGKPARVGLSTEPAVPGLAFVATLSSWVPWSGAESLAGVDVEVERQGALAVGRTGTVLVRIAAPSGAAITFEQGLPAGASVDEGVLRVTAGVSDVAVRTDRVRVTTRAFGAGEVMEIPIRVTPAFSGSFSTLPFSVEQAGAPGTRTLLAPLAWTVTPG